MSANMSEVSTMPELANLPADVLEHIILMLDKKTIKNLRQTCKRLSGFANQAFFRAVSLYDTPKSRRHLQSILAQPHLREEVVNLNLNTVEDDYDTDEEEEVDPPQGWKEILENLSRLPSLQSVVLRFDKKCANDADSICIWAPQSETYRGTLLRWLFAGLTDLSPPLKELIIQNHQHVRPFSRNFPDWKDEVLGTLESLKLNVVHERNSAAPESEIDSQQMHDFYDGLLQRTWLEPSMSSLRKLSLYSSHQWGCYPKVDLEDIHFPNLQSLALGNFTFCEDKQLDWILGHSSTLEELYLDSCFIVFYVEIPDSDDYLERIPWTESDMESISEHEGLIHLYPRRWHDYFTSIRNGLPRLSRFAFGNSPSWKIKKMPVEMELESAISFTRDRYSPFVGCGFEFYPFHPLDILPGFEWPECDQQDLDALNALHRAIGGRAQFH